MARIPVYQVTVPEYKRIRLRNPGPLTDKFPAALAFGTKVPKRYEERKPDFVAVGEKIDDCLKKHFLGQKVAIRALGSQEHKGKTQDDVIRIIKRLGHDRYDPKRKGDRYDNIENKKIEIFAMPPYKITKKGEYFRWFIEPFFYWPIHDRGHPVRVDIAIIYDPAKLVTVEHQYKGREGEVKTDGFVFKDPDDKPGAIKGIIKIL